MTKDGLQTLKEYFELSLLNSKVKMRNLIEYFRVVFNYYSEPSFAKRDGYLIFSYLFNSPFSVSKRFLMLRQEEDVYTYGETPLTTLEEIARRCRLSVEDVVFELGCGRGRTCLWLHQFIGCHVVGIDYVPEFIKRANEVKAKFNITGVEFRQQDMLDADLTGATVVYLYGSCYKEPFIRALAAKLGHLPKGTKIITVSYPLTDYTQKPLFEVINRFPARFTWGEADVYLQIKL